jgi:hypothetical protein
MNAACWPPGLPRLSFRASEIANTIKPAFNLIFLELDQLYQSRGGPEVKGASNPAHTQGFVFENVDVE